MEYLCRAQRKCGQGTHAKAFRRTEDEVKLYFEKKREPLGEESGMYILCRENKYDQSVLKNV